MTKPDELGNAGITSGVGLVNAWRTALNRRQGAILKMNTFQFLYN
jgi:hypothetical protein